MGAPGSAGIAAGLGAGESGSIARVECIAEGVAEEVEGEEG